MIKNLRSVVLSVLILFNVSLFSQSEHSTIYIARTDNSGFGLNASVFVGNQSPFNLGAGHAVSFKIYSEGEVSIGAQFNMGASLFCTLKVKRGNVYYLYLKPKSFLEVPGEKISRFLEGDVELRSENLDAPIYPNSVSTNNSSDSNVQEEKGQGTCFLISAEGYVVTNFHCVENAKELYVKGINNDFSTPYKAIVVGTDPSNDLALLKINENLKLNSPVFGIRSSGVAQAEKIFALGFPQVEAMGDEMKITEGIISARSGVHGDISKFQISAAVNPGNSGGPLIDESGNLVGVVYAKSTVAESAGYAIKASYLETFLKNVDGFTYPSFNNSIKDKTLSEKVADLKSFIYILETR